MPIYHWKGIDAQGRPHTGTRSASTFSELEVFLLTKGIALLSHTDPSLKYRSLSQLLSRPITNEHVFIFFEHVATLLDSGIELLQALEVTATLTHFKPMEDLIYKFIGQLKQGQDLEVIVAQHPTIFSKTMQKLIGAGEKTGMLVNVLTNLKDLLYIRITLYKELRKATQVPLITLVIALVLIGSIFMFILPHFQSLYESLNCPLPYPTKLALQISSWLHSMTGIVTMLSIFILSALIARSVKTTRGAKYLVDRFSLRLPLIKELIIYKELIIFSNVIEVFLRAGLPLAQALSHSIEATSHTVFKKNLEMAHTDLLEGQTLSSALQARPSPFIDQQFIALIHVGELSGTLEQVLNKASAIYQAKLHSKLHTLTTLATPILTVCIGLIIGGLMVTIYLPIFKLGTLFNA